MKRSIFALVVLLTATVALAQTRNPANAGKGTLVGNVPDLIGTVTYDTGAPADLFHTGINSSGNLFNSNQGAALQAGPVSQMTLFVGPGNTQASITIWPGPIPTGSVYFLPTLVPNTFNVVSITPFSVGTSFLAGMNGSLGFVSDSTAGQGFHGHGINWQTGTSIVAYSGENGMVRVTGDIVPVELMNFDVE